MSLHNDIEWHPTNESVQSNVVIMTLICDVISGYYYFCIVIFIFGSLWWARRSTTFLRHKLSCAYNPYKVKQLRWFWQFLDDRICGGLIKNKNDIRTSTNPNEKYAICTCHLWSRWIFVVKVKRWFLIIASLQKYTCQSWICSDQYIIRLISWNYQFNP